MTDTNPSANLGADPAAPLDLSAYTAVVIHRSGEVEGHLYRRGTRHSVDAATLTALREAGLIPADAAPPAGNAAAPGAA